MGYIDWGDVVGVGIVVSPDYTCNTKLAQNLVDYLDNIKSRLNIISPEEFNIALERLEDLVE
jgi:hypothetical protein